MSSHSPSRSTLADVLVAIAKANIPDRRKQEMASAVRTAAKAIGHPPDTIPADPRLLGIRLKSVSPLAIGKSEGRWNNVRSLLRAALTQVTPVMAGRDETPLSDSWATLFAVIAEKRSERIRLSRLVHWLSRHQILPQMVTLADLERFHQQLLTEALLRNPEETWIDTAQAWNRAVKAVPGWPQLNVERKSRKVTYVQHWAAFPPSLKADADAWLDRLACRDFTEDGPVKPVKPGTLATREYQLRSFASALVLRGRDPATLTSLAACLTYENFTEGLRFFRDRQGDKNTTTIHSMASMLKSVARHWVKVDSETFDKMGRAISKLAVEQTGLTQKNRDRLRPLNDPRNAKALVSLPQTLLKSIHSGKLSTARRMTLAQVAVAVEILLYAPVRIGNLAAIDIDKHLIRVGKKLHLVIPAAEVKNNTDLEFAFEDESAALVNWYITEIRRAKPGNHALFPGKAKDSKAAATLRLQISDTVKAFTGLDVHPHLFRHIAAQLYLDQHPGGYEVVRRVLGHKSMATTTNFYAGSETRGAGRHFASAITKLRHQTTATGAVA